jgi:hypothetical protein
VDGTGSGSCPMAGFGISGVEPAIGRWVIQFIEIEPKFESYFSL